MRPELTDEQLRELRSQAEAAVYRTLRGQLADDVLVIHSLAWLYKQGRRRVNEGEADFTVFVPGSGYITIEVKGGGIELDGRTRRWFTITQKGERREIKDPFAQGQRERHAVLEQLRGHSGWAHRRDQHVLMGHAVLLPEIEDSGPLIGPGRPREIIGVRADLDRIAEWVASVLHFWRTDDADPLTVADLAAVETILCSSIYVKPPLALKLAHEEALRIRLTDQQARILRILGGRARAAIGGGAGTGKTLIAVEKARRAAAEGKRTLLLCYNRPLADALRNAQRDIPSLEVRSYHQLCERRIAESKRCSARDVLVEAQRAYAGADLHDVQLPFALALANELVPDKYDAIIVDEAQDFREEYWPGVEGLLSDRETALLYVFFDPNQALHTRHGTLPIEDEPHWLTVNCRNTSYIHEAVYRYYRGETIDPPEIPGAPIEQLTADTLEEQAHAIAAEAGRLVTQERVLPRDIAVLVIGRPKKMYFDLLSEHKPAGRHEWAIAGAERGGILVDTVSRFKGLEATVTFVWVPPTIDSAEDRELLYVGLSRGKSRLYLVGTKGACAAALAPAAAGKAG